MSPRRPTIDGLDDIDDEDGVLEEEAGEETDLDLSVENAEDITGAVPTDLEQEEEE
jgi:hypothetical protein